MIEAKHVKFETYGEVYSFRAYAWKKTADPKAMNLVSVGAVFGHNILVTTYTTQHDYGLANGCRNYALANRELYIQWKAKRRLQLL